MKKTKKVLTSFVISCLGISAVALCIANINANKKANVTFAGTIDRTGTPKTPYLINGDEAEYIDFLTGFSAPDTNNASFARFRNDTFHAEKMRYFGMDYFCDTFNGGGDNWTGTFTSREFNQKGNPYVCFQFGGKNETDNYCQIQRYDEGTSTWVNLGDPIKNKNTDEPRNCQQLILRIVEIPLEYRSAKLRAQFHDGATGGYGGMTFGAFTGACTLDSAAKLFNLYKLALTDVVLPDSASTEGKTNAAAKAYIENLLNTWTEYSAVRTRAAELGEVNNISDSFETFEGFPMFTEDYLFSDDGGNHFNAFTNSYRTDMKVVEWQNNAPFNQTGDYLLSPTMNSAGSATAEGVKARFFSSPFILRGSRYLSIKMAGRSAKFTVWNADTYAELISVVDDADDNQRIFDDRGWSVEDICRKGSRTGTMTRVYVDCTSIPLGTKIFVSIEDYRTGGEWGLARFDEFVSYYDEVPTIGYDVITQTKDDVTGRGVCRDILVNGQDNDFTDAWSFLENTYFPKARNYEHDVASSFCSGPNTYDDGVKVAIKEAYDDLSPEAQAIVDASPDYQYSGYGTYSNVDMYKSTIITTYNVGQALTYMGIK